MVGRYQDIGGEWQPIDGKPYSKRLGDYIRADLRGEYAFRYSSWKLAVYAEVINAFNRANPAGLEYNRDYSESKEVRNLPRIIYLGLEARF